MGLYFNNCRTDVYMSVFNGYVDGFEFFDDEATNVQYVAVGSDGSVYYATNPGRIFKLNSSNGDNIWVYSAEGTPIGLCLDSSGGIYCCCENSNTIYKIKPNGSKDYSMVCEYNITAFTVYGGYIYCGSDDGYVYKYRSGEKTGLWIERYEVNVGSPITSISVDSLGYIYSSSADCVCKIDPELAYIKANFSFGNNEIEDISVDSDNNLCWCDYAGNVCKITNDGNFAFVNNLQVDSLWSIATDSKRNIYTCGYGGIVYKLDKNGKELLNINTGTRNLYDVAIDLNENIYCTAQGLDLLQYKADNQLYKLIN